MHPVVVVIHAGRKLSIGWVLNQIVDTYELNVVIAAVFAQPRVNQILSIADRVSVRRGIERRKLNDDRLDASGTEADENRGEVCYGISERHHLSRVIRTCGDGAVPASVAMTSGRRDRI